MVPGASGAPPTTGFKLFSVPCVASTGGARLLAATAPVNCATAGWNPLSDARTTMVVCAEGYTGCQVAEYWPVCWSLRNERAGSPLEKLAMTVASVTGVPQSSFSFTTNVAGQPAGTAKLLTRPVEVRTSREATHGAVTSGRGAVETATPDGRTIKVTLTVRKELASAISMPPV